MKRGFQMLAGLFLVSQLLGGCSTPSEDPLDTARVQQSTMSCDEECAAASVTCPEQCGGSAAECAAATSVCYDSCNRGVGPWLPC
jgi:hypothetical protein